MSTDTEQQVEEKTKEDEEEGSGKEESTETPETVDAPAENEIDSEESPNFPELESIEALEEVDQKSRVQLLQDVSLKVRVEFGRGKMLIKDLLRLTRGSVVRLDKFSGEPLEIFVNNKIIARGEVLILNEKFCVRVTEILTPEDCLRIKTD